MSFYCQMFIDIFDCDDAGTVRSNSELNIFILLGGIPVFLFHLEILVFHEHLYVMIYSQTCQ